MRDNQPQHHERRVSDEQLLQAREDIAAVRAELVAYREEMRGHLDTLRTKQDELRASLDNIERMAARIMERGKAAIWIIGGIVAAVAWMETRWQLLSRTVRSFLD